MARAYSQRAWSEDELNFLQDHYDEVGAVEAGLQLNRSTQSVTNRAYDMGLKTKHNVINRRGKSHGRFCGCEEITGTFWNRVVSGAKARGLDMEVSVQQAWNLFIQQNRRCKLSGVLISFVSPTDIDNSTTASLDRIDSAKGYVKGNIQWVHKDINQMKWHFDQGKFIHYCRMIERESRPKSLPSMGSWTAPESLVV